MSENALDRTSHCAASTVVLSNVLRREARSAGNVLSSNVLSSTAR
jgi:hypothetical protein